MSSVAVYNLAAGGVNPTSAGVEIPNSRRLVYVSDAQWCRLSYAGGGLGDCAVALRASADGGETWVEVVPYGANLGASSGVVLASEWVDLGDLVWAGQLLVAAWVRGAALLGGLLYPLQYVELQVR